MSDPYLGEIRLFAGSFAPEGWAFCDGQMLSIEENQGLFDLIGVAYGGDGVTTFALPDLRGRIPVGYGSIAGITYSLGECGGVESVALRANQLPAHSYQVSIMASTKAASSQSPDGKVLSRPTKGLMYAGGSSFVDMDSVALEVSPSGEGRPHDNMMPYLVISFIISLQGKSRS